MDNFSNKVEIFMRSCADTKPAPERKKVPKEEGDKEIWEMMPEEMVE